MNPLISVIIPVYNRENTIERCIESVLGASEKDLEIILVDDGSEDNSWSIIKSYAQRNLRIKAIHTENKGVSAARNRALELATGDYIHFLDSDDYITSNIYEKCREVIEEHMPDIIEFNYKVKFEGQEETYVAEMNKIPKGVLLERGFITEKILPVMVNLTPEKQYFINNFTPMKLFKGSIIRENKVLFDESRRRWEDRIYQVLFLKYAHTFYSMNEIGYCYVMGYSPSSNFNEQYFELILQGSKPYKKILGDMYNFEIPYCFAYYCRLLNDTVLSQFGLKGFTEERMIECLRKVTESEDAFELFSKFESENMFEKKVKSAILQKDSLMLYHIYQNKYIKIKSIEKIRNICNLPARLFNKIKRVLFRGRGN